MKIRRLRLAAYGPFTDLTLELPAEGSDFHLLYGPNEAGKSSTLRAVRHMLFGIPAQTTVDFLHGYARLRVGATLVNRNNGRIDFLRRKGRVKTLRGPDDETVLDDDALAPFLGGVSAEVFEQMFAIGHDDLIRGGEEIVSGKGSLGEALFAAGAGLIRLQNVQQALEQQCGDLFKPSGSTPAINQTLRALKETRQQQKEALLLPQAWQERDSARQAAQQRLAIVQATLAASRRRQARLERIQEALPRIVRKNEIDARLAAYHDVPDLADDFGNCCRDAEKELKLADRDVQRAAEAIAGIETAIAALPPHVALLDHAPAIEALQHELGSFRKARQDRPGLEGRMRTLQRQAADLLAEIAADLSPGAASQLHLPTATVSEIQKLGSDHQRMLAQRESDADQQRRQQQRFDRLSAQRTALAAPVAVGRLEQALQPAVEAGPLEAQLADRRAAAQALEESLHRALKCQTLWPGALAQIDALPLPARESIDRCEARFDELQRLLETQQAAKEATHAEIAQTREQLQAIDLSQSVPTEGDLTAARDLRDQGWGLIRGQLEGRPPLAEAVQAHLARCDRAAALPEAFETSLQRADQVADRLRREADQVSRKGLLAARKAQLEESLAQTAAALDQTLARQGLLSTEWQQLWQPAAISPLSPREMRAWLAQITALREKLADLRTRHSEVARLAARLAALTKDLSAALGQAGAPQPDDAPLTVLIKAAQAHIATQRERAAAIAAADKELQRLAADLEELAGRMTMLEAARAQWHTRWEACLRTLGIRADATPTAAGAVIEHVRNIRAINSEADVLRKRIAGIDRDSADFKARVDELVARLSPDLGTEPQDRATEQLNSRLTKARKEASQRQSLLDQRAAARQALEEARRRRFECGTAIEALCQAAQCQGLDDLAPMERRAREKKHLRQELADLEQQLRQLSAGAAIEAFIQEAAATDADRIGPERQELADTAAALEAERSQLDQQIGALQAQLDQMDGRSQAAAHAEAAERLLAGLEADVETYARLKIAAVILARTVEQYREKHQGPLIARASDLFARMTLGAFSRLRADYDDKGNPVLVGIRAHTDAQVTVDGMSDGTADQLYLSLRLASLEQYLENNEPLPFIVDDILLRFDDERSLATLNVLAELAKKTQVLFFTHHRHLVELAEGCRETGLEFTLHHL